VQNVPFAISSRRALPISHLTGSASAVAPPRAASPVAAAPSEPVYEDGVVIEVAKVHRPQVVHSSRHHHKRHHAATGRPKRSTVKMFEYV